MQQQRSSVNGTGSGPRGLLSPEESVVVLIDHQPAMFYGIQSHDRQTVINNTTLLAKAAKAFGVPVILSTINAKGFGGPILSEVQEIFPEQEPIDRTQIDAWEDPNLREAVLETGRRQIVMAGLWTEACLAYPVIAAREEGLEVYAVADASGGASVEAHNMAMQRMIQAGATPVTSLDVLFEFQRDWAREETAPAVLEISKQHGGAYGQTIVYAESLLFPALAGSGSNGEDDAQAADENLAESRSTVS